MSTTDFIAELQCQAVINGVIHVQINNINTLWDLNEYSEFDDCMPCMKLMYQDRSKSTVKEEKVKIISVGCVGEFGDIYIRVPVYLHSYEFEFALSTKNTTNHQWFPKSPTQTIQIPPFLSEDIYSVGDIVSFSNPLNCKVSEGIIIEELQNRNYKLLYHQYEEQIPRELTAHISTIAAKAIDNQKTVEIPHDVQTMQMRKNLLMKRDDSQSIYLFKAIRNGFDQLLCDNEFNDCLHGWPPDVNGMFQFESIGDFITKNVFDYLCSPQFCYTFDCFIDHNHGALTLSNLRVKDIENEYQILKDGVCNAHVDVDSFDDIEYSCNICRCCLKEWDYVYSCCANNWYERHDFCLFCLQTVIQLNKQLSRLLCDILHNHLNIDCIQTMVHYVIGRVRYTQLDLQQNKKRKLCHEPISNAKQRKLH